MPISSEMFAAAQRGDPVALDHLLLQLQPDIRRYARIQCHRSSVIEDVVQEALFILYRRVGSVRSAGSLAAWVGKVVARLCMLPALMLMRGVEELSAVNESLQFAAIPTDDLRIDLAHALESLSESHRQVILLRDMQELTIDEISRELRLTREAVKSRLHRARAMMRDYLLPGHSK